MEPFIGQIVGFGGNFAPRGWAFCDGQLLAISSNTALFSILGTMYGGDGRTTFALPDLRGRSMIGPGNGPGLPNFTQGQKGGAITHTLNISEIPSHNHSPRLHGENTTADRGNPNGTMLARTGNAEPAYAAPVAADNVAMAAESITSSNQGGSQSFSIQNPYLAVPFIIALQGTFPSRS